ncbi:MAG: glycoside hydrolase family 97 catalytic domain-containing protein [Verrucomicrobiales bacterium]|nr:glycoside hydrolase family 97 catalytic domain-containing protein [Verrucomicrobiales bacterium]
MPLFRRLRSWFVCALISLAPFVSAAQRPLTSPDGRIRVSFDWPARRSTALPRWSASFRGQTVLKDCELGLTLKDQGAVLAGAVPVSRSSRRVKERIPVLHGRSDHAANEFRETRVAFDSPTGGRVDIVFRCFNDAVAFRYELPAHPAMDSVTILEESSTFRLQGQPTAYAQYLENYRTSHEHEVVATPYHELRPHALLDTPLTLAWGQTIFAAITEASLRHYAGMALSRVTDEGSQSDTLISRLTPRPDGAKVVGRLPLLTPWRVVLLAERPGALLESETLYALNDPCAIGDTSWIRPGKITFHWWNGDVFDGQPGLPILAYDTAVQYIDFCARNGIPCHSMTSTEGVTTPWYFQTKPGVEPGPDTDVTRPRPGFELERIRQYAATKGVRLWTWVHQAALRGRVEEAFAAFEKMGWSGMMVDFFDHDDQDHVEFAEQILAAAARHHILIHLHGVWKPTGWQRTYPNLMNHEGALNLEYLKWSDRCTPAHNLNMAYTRLIAGPMDYHLGGFRAVTRANFKPQNVAPLVLGTRAHMLGLYVCFDNPMPMVADYPTAYEGQPGFDFLKLVPTYWDETRVVSGEIGESLVTARRRGTVWYVGCLSARPRQITLPLAFLERGRYQLTLWKDAPDAARHPNHLELAKQVVTSRSTLVIDVAEGGGFVAQLVPSDQ